VYLRDKPKIGILTKKQAQNAFGRKIGQKAGKLKTKPGKFEKIRQTEQIFTKKRSNCVLHYIETAKVP